MPHRSMYCGTTSTEVVVRWRKNQGLAMHAYLSGKHAKRSASHLPRMLAAAVGSTRKRRTIFPPSAFLIRRIAYHSLLQPRDTAMFRLQIAGRIGFLLHDGTPLSPERHAMASTAYHPW